MQMQLFLDTKTRLFCLLHIREHGVNLNPVDLKVCGTMQDRVYRAKVWDVDDLKQRLIDVWDSLEQSAIDDTIDQWRSRLRACVHGKGGIFWTIFVTRICISL